ncbi:hypothetical protein [Aeromicrobium sp. Leaf350]|uniref:hypothetical protein n=1 Tax=Aeromicrobium sp. Leaf350 TaxID=2876565 RepID=UPI001E623DA0|nr:hypothetical protein [Aeromicrobium sp. Leaf350]
MRRTVALVVVALLVAAVAGCGAVNKGTAFAGEFQRLLDDRENVVDSSISASNNLPWSGTASVSVTLADDLNDSEIVEEVWEITAQEVDNQIAYSLQVDVEAENADGGPARTQFAFRVRAPAPDDDGLRDDIADRLDRARALAALGSGETSVEAFSGRTTLTTQADALTIAGEVCSDEQLADLVETFSVSGVLPTGEASAVTFNDADDCDWLVDAREVLDALGTVTVVAGYDATRQVHQAQPRLRVSVPGAQALDLTAAETTASRLGLTLEVVSV